MAKIYQRNEGTWECFEKLTQMNPREAVCCTDCEIHTGSLRTGYIKVKFPVSSLILL